MVKSYSPTGLTEPGPCVLLAFKHPDISLARTTRRGQSTFDGSTGDDTDDVESSHLGCCCFGQPHCWRIVTTDDLEDASSEAGGEDADREQQRGRRVRTYDNQEEDRY